VHSQNKSVEKEKTLHMTGKTKYVPIFFKLLLHSNQFIQLEVTFLLLN